MLGTTGEEKANLSDSEWETMNLLQGKPSWTIMNLTRTLKSGKGQSKNTVITMLNRMEAKDAARHEEGERAKLFYPAIDRMDVTLQETKGFLERVYKGSVGLVVDATASSKSLPKQETEGLYEILRKAEGGAS